MGIQDRDYYRDGSGGFFDAWGRQGATIWIIAITSVVFLLQCFDPPPATSGLVAAGAYEPRHILQGEVWRLFTPMLLHASFMHILFNMLVLYFFGRRLEETYGTLEFVLFYVLGGVFASVVYLLLFVAGVVGPSIAIGASGAVTAVVILFALNFPRQQVLLFFVIPMPMWVLGVMVVVWDMLGAAGAGNRTTAYVVHLGGAAFGALYYLMGVRFTALFARRHRTAGRRVRSQLRVIPADPDDTPEPVGAAVESQPRPKATDETLEAKVDQVLEKVSKYGQESLTPEERDILFKASELYKKRRK
jgi:membrane associated rhomboid family serine protease